MNRTATRNTAIVASCHIWSFNEVPVGISHFDTVPLLVHDLIPPVTVVSGPVQYGTTSCDGGGGGGGGPPGGGGGGGGVPPPRERIRPPPPKKIRP